VTDDETAPGAGAGGRGHKRVTDAQALTALTHPTRFALFEAIGLAGSLTATQAAAVVGESPTACAYHLRALAALGFLEETGGGRGRERPWRLAQTGMSFDTESDDPEVATAARALSRTLLEHWIKRIRAFELTRSRQPAEVRDQTGPMQTIMFATPEEMRAFRAELRSLFHRYVERADPALRPDDGYAFELLTFTTILDIPHPGDDDAPAASDP